MTEPQSAVCCALILGFLCSFLGTHRAVREYRFRHGAVRTRGIVRKRESKWRPGVDGAKTEIITLTIEFHDATGAARQSTGSITSRSRLGWPLGTIQHAPSFEVGESVFILTNPNQPENIRIDAGPSPWVLALFLVGAGISLLALGLLIWVAVL